MDTIAIRPIYDGVWETINLGGDVQHPGAVQWRPDLGLKEVIEQGGLLPTSDLTKAEVIRLNKDLTDRQVIPVALGALLKGDQSQNIPLKPKDEVRVYTLFKNAETVSVTGEVLRPGTYEIMKDERLSDLLRRAGGITAQGYAYGAVFKRTNVKASENKNLQAFTARMQKQMLMIAAGSAAATVNTEEASAVRSELTINQSLIENLKAMQTQQEGRVAITITGNIDEWAGTRDDLVLQDGDSLFIPKRPQEVLVVGEVYSPGASIFLPEMSVQDYLDRSGGFTKYADHEKTFVVQANGFAYGSDSPKIGDVMKSKLQPGDAVFVPQKMEQYATMRTTKDIIDILFKTAVVIATITILF
jgi:protein involved in polysaccharide export with SLBB domain